MSDNATGQVNASAAEVYEEFFIPALFREWAPRVADAAQIHPGDRVLDVACGTGILARLTAERVGPDGSVVGLDINPGMLQVARRQAPAIEWREGRAELLPFDDNRFDAVVSQFGLMFFQDRIQALREMMRVLRPSGRLAVAVWDALDTSPGYAALADLLRRLYGESTANALYAPFALGDSNLLGGLFEQAGIAPIQIETRVGTAHFSSIHAWMFTDIRGWTLADALDDARFDTLVAEAGTVLNPFVNADGSVTFDVPAHIVTATKP